METDKKDTKRAPWWQSGLVLFTKLSGWIIGPVLLGVILGKWLDRKYGTEPWLFLVTVGVAFFLSMFGIVRDSLREMKRIEEKEVKNKKQETRNNNQTNSKLQ
ncbi:MAG: AtpZ/AtpI family protein [Parcubacteria group bacterium]|jgi:F0F1-type ATP synthase assembly protein I